MKYKEYKNNLLWIPIINIVLSATSMILIIKYIVDVINLYKRIRNEYFQDKNDFLERQKKNRFLQYKNLNQKYFSNQNMESPSKWMEEALAQSENFTQIASQRLSIMKD